MSSWSEEDTSSSSDEDFDEEGDDEDSDLFLADTPQVDSEEEEEEEDVYNIDDSLSPIDRFNKCVRSKEPALRYVEAKRLAETAEDSGFDTLLKSIVPMIPSLLDDEEWKIRYETMKQIPEVAKLLLLPQNRNEGYKIMIDILVNTISKLFEDPSQEVRNQTVNTFISLSKHAESVDLGTKILALVIEFAHDDESEEKRIAAAELLHLLASIVGPVLARDYVLSEVESLSQDHAFRVRKAVALHFDSSFDSKLPIKYHTKLMKTYINLCRDEAWVVRTVCVQKMVQISQLVTPGMRSDVLIPELATLSKDPNDWVRKAVYRDLGEFIASLPSASVTKELLYEFTSLFVAASSSSSPSAKGGVRRNNNNNNNRANRSSQNSRRKHKDNTGQNKGALIDLSEDNTGDSIGLAYAKAFPKILSVVGETRWNELSDLFDTLTFHEKSEVRCTMAESLSHIATILGPDVAERELLNTLDRFLQDDAKVRKKVIENLVDLLAALGPECRESYLAVLAEVMQSTANLSWRFRMLLGKQLPQLSRLFSPMATYGVVVKILFALLDDDVADVRLSTLAGIPHVLTRVKEIKEHPSWFDALIERLCKFESSPTYNKRLMFVKMCIPIASTKAHENTFLKNFFQLLLRMCVDPVSNVRLAAVETLHKCPEYVSSKAATIRLVRTRLRDPQRDVVQAAARFLISRGQYDESDEQATWYHYSMVSIAPKVPDLTWWRHLGGRLNGDDKVESFRNRHLSE